MATVSQKSYGDLRPIRYKLKDKDRSLDLNVPAKYSTQQGNNFLEYDFLVNSNDVKIKNYTTNFLTDTKTEEDIFDLKFNSSLNNSFITTIQFDDKADQYLTLNKTGTSLSGYTALSALSTGDDNLANNQSFVIDLSGIEGRPSVCSIWTYDGNHKKYLALRGTNQTVIPELLFDTLVEGESMSRFMFDVILDSSSKKAILSFHESKAFDGAPAIKAAQWVVGTNDITNTLSALSGFNLPVLSAAAFTFTNYNTIDTNYSSKSNNFNYYSNGTEIDSVSSIPNQKHNFLFYNNYENNYLSGDEVYGNLSYFNLKNQISNNNHVNKRLPFAIPQQQRYYNSILNSEDREISEEDLKLSYNFYTAEYKFLPDRYTKFKLPDNISPFKTLNINDADFQGAGAYAAESPYFSDRIYKLLDESNNNKGNEENGSFLCSWLYDDGINGTWYDRYYFPKYTTPVATLTGSFDEKYTTVAAEISAARRLFDNNMYYYDIPSLMLLEPNNTYYYARIGKSYIANTLNGISNKVIKSDFDISSTDTESIIPGQDKIVLDGTHYDSFDFPTQLTADQGALSLSFSLNVPILTAGKAHQLIGNIHNTGISIAKNFYFTPFIILPHENSLNYYDHEFNLVRSNTFNSISAIHDVLYMSQGGDVVLVGRDHNQGHTGRLLRVNFNGDVVRDSSHSLAREIVQSNYTSRVFHGVGSRVKLFAASKSYILDLQTLSVDMVPPAGTGMYSGVLSAVGTHIGAVSGYRGVNIDGEYAASVEATYTGVQTGLGSQILFTKYSTGETFTALQSLSSWIWDINAYDNKLYVLTDGPKDGPLGEPKLRVYNTSRDLLSTINLSTSATSGYKIDFISDDYTVKPVVFSRKSDYELIAQKIDTSNNNALSTYSLGISSLDTGGIGHFPTAGKFVSPTNLHSMEDYFKEYEDKFCFVARFDNEIAYQGVKNPWNTFTPEWSAFETGNWEVEFTNSGLTLVDNSNIQIIEGIKDGYNCIQADLDLVTGNVRIFVNGALSNDFTINAGIKPLKNYLYNKFYIGTSNYSDKSVNEITANSKTLAKNIVLKDINVFNTTLSKDILKYLYLDCSSDINPVNFDIVTAPRNNIETINNYYTYKIPGNLSNKIKILIKNGGLKLDEQAIIAKALKARLPKFLPATINENDIEFDFRIGNEQPLSVETPLQLQPRLPLFDTFSNVWDPGVLLSMEITTDFEPVLFDRDGSTAFIMII